MIPEILIYLFIWLEDQRPKTEVISILKFYIFYIALASLLAEKRIYIYYNKVLDNCSLKYSLSSSPSSTFISPGKPKINLAKPGS